MTGAFLQPSTRPIPHPAEPADLAQAELCRQVAECEGRVGCAVWAKDWGVPLSHARQQSA